MVLLLVVIALGMVVNSVPEQPLQMSNVATFFYLLIPKAIVLLLTSIALILLLIPLTKFIVVKCVRQGGVLQLILLLVRR